MPLELVVNSPRDIGYAEYDERAPAGSEVLVQTSVSGIKSGTEINLYRGQVPFAAETWDSNLRVFRPIGDGEQVTPFFPHTLGSWAAGVVRQVGPGVRRFQPGDYVHGEWKHRQSAILQESQLYPVAEQSDCESMIFTDPARFALAAIHDAAIKLGDRVAIFGLGAIGLLAAQMARLSGAGQISVVDPVQARLDLALSLGADVAVNPTQCDAGIAIKEATHRLGVDVALEISGVYAALQQAIRCVHRGGLVVTASYYADQDSGVDLAREWHHNRITLRSSMPVWGNSLRHHPMWDMARLEQTAVKQLEEGRLQVKPLIGARIPFEQAAEAYAVIDLLPNEKIKILLTYANGSA